MDIGLKYLLVQRYELGEVINGINLLQCWKYYNITTNTWHEDKNLATRFETKVDASVQRRKVIPTLGSLARYQPLIVVADLPEASF